MAACSGTGSYQDQTEDFIDDDPAVEQLAGGDVSRAECEEPTSADIDTTYSCTADVAESGLGTFSVRINAENSFLVETVDF